MTNKENIRIDYLCHEPFWNFSKKGTHEYCKVCKHEIKDFTGMDKQTATDTLEQLGGTTCGIFFKNQFIQDEQTKIGKSFKSLLFAGGLSTILNLSTQAQTNNATTNKTEQVPFDSLHPPQAPVQKDVVNDCITNGDPSVSSMPAYRKRHWLRIGRRRIYVNFHFPFLHIHIAKRGKVKKHTSTKYL